MKRILLITLFAGTLIPTVSAQSTDLVKYDKDVVKSFLLEKIKREKNLNLEEAQRELLGYKLDEYIADWAQKYAFGLSQQQISDLQDSTKALANVRKEINKLNKSLAARQVEVDQLKTQSENYKIQMGNFQASVKQLQGYKEAAEQTDALKKQMQDNEERYQADLMKVAEKHDSEMAALNGELNDARTELSDQKEKAEALQSQIDDLNRTLEAQKVELAKWQGGVENVLAAIEHQCDSAKVQPLRELNPLAFQSLVNSFEGMRHFVQEIDPTRVSSIDRQIGEVDKLMKVGEVFKEALDYIQGRQDASKAREQITQLNNARSLTGLSVGQVSELEAMLSALQNQGALYRDFRDYLTVLRSKRCLPTAEKIKEQLSKISLLEEIDGFLLSPEYHKTYVAAIGKLKEILQQAVKDDEVIDPMVWDDAKFPGLIDEIVNML